MADYDFLAKLQQMNPQLSSIFSPQDPMQQEDFMGPQLPMGPQMDQMNPLQGLFQPSYEHMNAYANQINQMPQRTEPTTAQRIGAGISSLAAIGPATYHGGAALGIHVNPEQQRKIIDEGLNGSYYDKLKDWQAKNQPMGELAKLEGTSNVNQRITSDEILRRNLEAGRLGETQKGTEIKAAKQKADEEHQQAVIDQKEKDRQVRMQRVAVADFVAKNKGRKVLTDSENHVYTINPETNEAEYALTPEGEYVEASSLSDAQKLDIQHKNKLSELEARGATATNLEGTKQTNREKNIESIYQGKKDVKETVPGKNPTEPRATPTKALTPAQEAKVLSNKANILIATRPDLAPFIDVSSGVPKINEPNRLFGGTDPKREEARSILFGTTPGVMEKTQTNTETGEKRTLVSKDGGKTWLPK